MNISFRCVLLSVAISLSIIQSTLAEPYRHAATGITFPDRMATLEKEEQTTNYEAKNPGLGISVGYNGPGIIVTVYVYTMGIKTIPSDLNSSILKDHFRQASGDIAQLVEMGIYSNLNKISEDEVVWGDNEADPRSLHGSFSYSHSGRDLLSHLYLLGFRNHFIKIRFTYDKEIKEPAEKIQKDFLRELGSILRGIGKDMHKKEAQPAQ